MIKAILFDLGGVLVHFAGVGPMLELSGGKLSEKEAWDFWWNSEVVQAFEKGKISPEVFAADVIKALRLDVTVEYFLNDFARWEKGPYPGALALLEGLKEQYTVACLTNNNVVHWETLRSKSEIGSRFHRCFISFETGMLKPDPGFYLYAVHELKMEPGEILFLDDSLKNVEAASGLGMRAFNVRGIGEVKRVLKEENIYG